MKKKLVLIGSIVLVGFSCWWVIEYFSVPRGIKRLADGTWYLVKPDQLVNREPEGMPIILDQPIFVTADEANAWLQPDEVVCGIDFAGEQKAYPRKILVHHELVYDIVGDNPILMTYSPLCGAAIAFDARIKKKPIYLSVSEKLFNNNLIMIDEKTHSLWTQLGGRAIIGPLTGKELTKLSVVTMTWNDWKMKHPDTTVLTSELAMNRNYRDPYTSYYRSDEVFGIDQPDTRLHPKQMVAGIVMNNQAKAYPVAEVAQISVVNDTVGNVPVLALLDPQIESDKGFELNPIVMFDRRVEKKELGFVLRQGKLVDRQTESEWNFDGLAIAGAYAGKQLQRIVCESCMWFAWAAFHPDTKLFLVKTVHQPRRGYIIGVD